MNFTGRLQGVFFNPQPTFKAISEKPVWIDALVVVLIITAIFSYISAPYVNQDTLKAMKDNIKLQDRLGKERFDQTIQRFENPSRTGIILRSVLLSPITLLIGLLISSLVLLVIGRMFSTEGTFVLVFAGLLHANFIDKILGGAVRLALILTRKSVFQTTTSLALLAPKADFTSTTYIILSQLDFFQLWMFAVIGYGLSSIFKIPVKKAMVISYSFWLLKSLLYVAMGFLSRSFMG